MMDESYIMFFKALSNPGRAAIVGCLRQKRRSVSQICDATGFEQSRVSHQLKMLSALGLLNSERDGRRIYYCLDADAKDALKSMEKFLKRYGEKLCSCGILLGKSHCRHMEDTDGKKEYN